VGGFATDRNGWVEDAEDSEEDPIEVGLPVDGVRDKVRASRSPAQVSKDAKGKIGERKVIEDADEGVEHAGEGG
jgi:hypothetical protein